MRLIISAAACLFCLIQIGCKSGSEANLKEGTWRATLTRDNQELPLLLDISKNPDGKTYSVFALNGKEKLRMDTAYFANDSLVIPMQLFDAKIVAKADAESLKGTYYRLANGVVAGSLPFEAKAGENYRFFKEGVAKTGKNVTGKWMTYFMDDKGDSTQAVGNLTQTGTDVSGSFLTTTGDYRFLTGSVNGDSLFLSTFDGSNAKLFKAAIQDNNVLKGALWSGVKAYKTWEAKLDPNAALPDAAKLTFLKPGFETVDFTFPDSDGKMWSLKDPKFQGKAVIIQIMGSWCPNCMDETNFMAPWYKSNKDRGVEMIGLSFERSDDPKVSNPKLKRMISRFDIQYPILLAGTNTDEATAKALPMLNKVMSYPTTIFIDRKGKVREIHTGFSGPGTGKYYDEFVTDFNSLMDKLIAEK
ncbi:peroxiredoxin family protein [Dyadobacter luticola]|uniref:TlpA family protein disulfide reductase n=1 Tax=Dyadobacter luticola TaxID=1979387 RepID=A0A5R9KP77_9BACT|nr:TlpA disulfide reductase family protein [Dyadobacter luticola]TLU97949.1 TlpA family protein disulfide reductase [Dyadobacter luticola]